MGTWEKIEGRFLLGSSSSHTLGSTGGEENHTLTTSEIPSHTHGMTGVTDTAGTYNAWGVVTKYAFVVSGSTYIENTTAAGGGGSHNNMPPYYTVNIWRRTA
jgi:microcystin-dependent protein